MQTITLKNDASHNFSNIDYPDGQKSVQLHFATLTKKEPIQISCRIKNFAELERLGTLLASLHHNDYYVKTLDFKYLFGIRSDRAFNAGEPNYTRDVLAPIINDWVRRYNIEEVIILWPFTPLAILNNHFINCYSYIDTTYKETGILRGSNQHLRISGDESAYRFEGIRNSKLFTKKRIDGTILISLDNYDLKELNSINEIVIVDDLCDGGGTFIAEAKYLKEIAPHLHLYLYVYHGLFTNGALDKLADYFEHIYCTNSYSDLQHQKLTQFEVII